MHVYILSRLANSSSLKIGYSENIQNRMKELGSGVDSELVIENLIKCRSKDQMTFIEKGIHLKLSEFNVHNEWFDGSCREIIPETLDIYADRETDLLWKARKTSILKKKYQINCKCPNFGNALESLRVDAGYSQNQLSKLLNMSQPAMNYWEAGKGYPQIPTLLKLCEFYGVTPNDLLLLDK